jgi:hypothetical protein
VLPVLVLTDVVGVIVSTNGVPLKTGTLVQPAPAQATNGTMIAADCSAWKCWSVGQQAGTGVAIVVAAIGILVVLVWGFCWRPGKREKDVEEGTGRVGWRGWGRKKGAEESGSGSEDSGEKSPRRSIVVEIPSSVHGGPSKYRVMADPPTRRESTRRAAEMPPEPAPEGPPPTHQPSKGQTEMPPDPGPSTPRQRASQRSSYYYPKVRDFAFPAAGLAGAAAASKSREKSSQPRRQSTREARSSRGRAPPPASMSQAGESWRRDSQRRSREEVSDREARHSSREGRKGERDRDADRDRGSGREGESRRGSRGRNIPREPRVSRERRVRR